MSENEKRLIDHPAFVSALSYAKALASNLNLTSLTPELMFAGFLSLSSKLEENGLPDFLVKKVTDIGSILTDIGISVPQNLQPVTDIKFPLSEDLKKLIASAENELESFIDTLVGRLRALKTLNSPLLTQIIAYASKLSITRQEEIISPEILSAAAFIAFRQRAIDTNQSISNYFLSNTRSFQALIEEFEFRLDTTPDPNQKALPLSDDIIKSMVDASTDGERFLAAINIGLGKANALISKIAVAYHEAGHAVVSAILIPSVNVTEVSVVKDGDADGVTVFDGRNPSFYYQKTPTIDDFYNELAVALAGRAAQLIKFGFNQIDAGAYSDIEGATEQAWRCVARAGLDQDIGPINLEVIGKLQGHPNGELFDQVQKRVQAILKESAERAETLLRANWDQVESVTKSVLEKNKLNDNDFALSFATIALSNHADAISARSVPVERDVVFATSNGILQTPEGPVRYNAGDALVSDFNEHQWPLSLSYFEKYYVPISGITMGTDGRYKKKLQAVKALQLLDNRRLDLPDGRGLLLGRKGDWIVEYGNGEWSIVGAGQFPLLYELMN